MRYPLSFLLILSTLLAPLPEDLAAQATLPPQGGAPAQPGADDSAQAERWYSLGLERLDRGDVQGALDVWYEAWDSLSSAGIHDPRIGLAYVELVAREELRGEYETASEIFGWGFSGHELAPYMDEVREEVARTLPIMTPEAARRLQALMDAEDPEVLREIRLFWMQKDPTPNTPKNERLLEHWERIAFARDRYVRGRYTPYGTDDRGTIYVKFGEPDKKTGGTLGAREDELRIWIRDPLVREVLRRYDSSPQFEIWVYDRLNPREFVYFLFGNLDGSGRFQLLDTPRDLISDAAWSAASRRVAPGGIKIAYYLEFFYYSDLAAIGGPYADRFSELEHLWGTWESRGISRGQGARPPPEGDLEAFDQRYLLEDRYHRTDKPVHPDFSFYDDGSRAVELVVEPFRVLSPDDEPQLYIVALSGPKTRVESTSGRIRRRDIVLSDPEYRATHTLVIRDREFREIGRVAETVTPEDGDMSVFVLRHVPQRLLYSFIVEVERDAEEARLETSQLPARTSFEVPPPLETDPGRLVMSDVLTGVAPGPDESYPGLPFPVIPSRTIWREDPVRLYVELYHLATDEVRVARYRYEFTIEPVSEGDPAPPGARSVTLSMDLEYRGPTARDVFDIDISALPLGTARVRVRATDLQSGQVAERSIPIEIVR
ncbi:MAG: GWxTD domain-containing protein [Gemmatimonadota bacterium]